MWSNQTILAIGGSLGFLTFVYNVMTMDGIIYRPDINGQPVFTLSIMKDYMIAPFAFGTTTFDTVWGLFDELPFMERIKLLQINWIAMVVAGLASSCLFILFQHIF
jgi:hypothetical protein